MLKYLWLVLKYLYKYIWKIFLFQSAVYMYDDLHSLDNDSFLTSLETISEKDRFDFEWKYSNI